MSNDRLYKNVPILVTLAATSFCAGGDMALEDGKASCVDAGRLQGDMILLAIFAFFFGELS